MLFTLFRRKRPTASPRPPGDRLKKALSSIQSLPMMPGTAVRAMGLVNDPNHSLADFAELVRRDGAVTASVLKLANSAVYRTGRPAETLPQAVLRLGSRGCLNMLTAIGMRGLFRGAKQTAAQNCELLWRHSYITATLCSLLNRSLELGFVGEEFTAGLLHDLGRILLAVVLPDEFDAADPLDFDEDMDVLAREREVLKTDHCVIGRHFGERNLLPNKILACIRFHHAPTEAVEHSRLTALVAVADHVANHIVRERRIANYDAAQNFGLNCLCAEQDDPLLRNQFIRTLPTLVVRAMRETRSMLKASC